MELTQDVILRLIKKGESETLEFKRRFDREAIETLVAFANTGGGKVLVGITDSGRIEGLTAGKETLQKWINQIKQSTAYALIPDVEVVQVKGKTIAILSVSEYPIKPVACKGRYFKRVKNANHQMTVSEMVDTHLKTFNSSWDFYPDEVHLPQDISLEKVRAFIDRMNTLKPKASFDDPLTLLKKCELIREGRVSRAAFLLFMASESSLSTIELGRFQTETIIKDGERLKTDLFNEVEGVMAFVRKHINVAFVISGKLQREERWEYPLDGLREIIINAIVYRDYSSSSDSVIKIFDDRIEFFNPGTLPAGLTVKKLMSGDYVSMIRNRLVADIFKEGGLIEKYGTGIRRILKAFRDYDLPDPKFEEIAEGFRVTVYGQEKKVESGEVTGEVTGEVMRLLPLCREPASRKELMEKLGLRHEDHFRKAYLVPALKGGLIEWTVPDKPRSRLQRYRLTVKGKAIIERKY